MKIFKPTIHLLNRMKYSIKFVTIGLILIVPLITVSLFYLQDVTKEMEQIEKRVEGAKYNLVLKDALQNIQQSRGLSISLIGGDDSVKENLQAVNEKANTAFAELKALESKLSRNYSWPEKSELIQQSWKQIEQTKWTSSEEILTEYAAITAEIISLMSEVANDSELLLALSPESFNLIYDTSIELPSLTEYLAQMRALGVSAINSGQITEEQLNEMSSKYVPIKTLVSNIQKTAQIVFNNPEFKELLEEKFHEVENSISTYLSMISQITKGNLDANEFYSIATEAINGNFEFFTLSFEVLFNYLDAQYNDLYTKVISTYIILFVVIVLAVFLFMSLYLAIRQSIKSLEQATAEVANGNLGVQVSLHTKDEMSNIEKSFNRMVSQLNNLVREISVSAEHVSSSSQELHASSEEITAAVEHTSTAANQMAQDAEVQASSLKESAQAMNEMAIGIEKIAENSTRVSNLTNETTNLANDGNDSVEKAFKQMEIIRESVKNSSDKIAQLHQQSAKIDAIVNIITEIAAQTNLLSLNAAIEAARAGEHGKGFAVVADEVRKLAEQSSTSAAQIAELIRSIQIETTESVRLMDHVNESVKIGMEITGETANKFENILSSMQTLKPQMEEISSTAVQLSAQTQEVVSSIQQILGIAQQTSESTEEIAASTEEQLAIMEDVSSSASSLAKMAESLQQLVSQFQF